MIVDFLEKAGWDGEDIVRISRGTEEEVRSLRVALRELADGTRALVNIHELPGFDCVGGIQVIAELAGGLACGSNGTPLGLVFRRSAEAWVESVHKVEGMEARPGVGFNWIVEDGGTTTLLSWSGSW